MFFDNDYAFLSNFVPSPVNIKLMNDKIVVVDTVEHGYQALKMTNLRNQMLVAAQSTPGKAKRLGNELPMRFGWDAVKESTMLALLIQKFAVAEFRELLRATGDGPIEETNNWHDQVWGNCVCPRHVDEPGYNMLGQLLEEIQESLVNE